MRIVLYELRKMFEWKRVLTASVLCFVIYFMLIDFELSAFQNARPVLDIYNISKQMIAKYGTDIDDIEFADFQETYDREVERFNEYLQSREEFQAVGITNYEEFRVMKDVELYDKVVYEEELDLFWELQAREYLMESYENTTLLVEYSENQLERYQEVINRAEQSIFQGFIKNNYQKLITNTAIMIVLSISIILLPNYIAERHNHMFLLQYSSKIGRRLFLKKMLSSIIAAGIITTIELVIILILYQVNDTSVFFQLEINSVFSDITWYDMTFLQYIILSVLLVYILGIIMTTVIMFVSRLAPNYLTAIGIQIPILILLFGVLLRYMLESPIQIDFPQLLAPALYVGLIAITAGLLLIQFRKERKVDIDF